MLLTRFATVELSVPAPTNVPPLTYNSSDGIEVKVVGTHADFDVGTSLDSEQARPAVAWTGMTEVVVVLLAAEFRVELDFHAFTPPHLPAPPERAALETAIEDYADLLALLHQCARRIGSPLPAMMLQPESDQEAAWLGTFDSIAAGGKPSSGDALILPPLIAGSPLPAMLLDRRVGMSLLAEAMSAGTPVSRLRDLVRVIEHGFKLAAGSCVDPLTEFLGYWADRLGFNRDEVEFWLTDMRGSSAHADVRQQVARGFDHAIEVRRLEFAAYDLLFHKATWRSPDTERRTPVLPLRGAPGRAGGSVLMQPTAMTRVRLTDPYGSYPLDMRAKITLQDSWLIDAERDHTTKSEDVGPPTGLEP